MEHLIFFIDVVVLTILLPHTPFTEIVGHRSQEGAEGKEFVAEIVVAHLCCNIGDTFISSFVLVSGHVLTPKPYGIVTIKQVIFAGYEGQSCVNDGSDSVGSQRRRLYCCGCGEKYTTCQSVSLGSFFNPKLKRVRQFARFYF